ncbi:MAG: hypothetical protein OXC40_05350, partial [Proteobacteria bacterium]|nr:hypothetical protein [Pseudomonadota bacterium]
IYEISHRQGIINAARSFDNQQAVYDSLLYHAEQKGKSRNQREIIQRLFSLGSDIPFICQATGLGKNDVAQIIQDIKNSEDKW